MLQRRQQRGGKELALQRQARAEPSRDEGGSRWVDARGGGASEPVNLGAGGDGGCAVRQPGDFLGADSAHGRQVGPLIGLRFQGAEIQEHRGPSLPALPLERSGEEVPDGVGARQRVLGGEQPVVAAQVHLTAQRHRLPKQAHAESSCGSRRNSAREEQPNVGANAGSRDLECSWCPERSSGLQVGQGVEHGCRAVKVRGHPMAAVVSQQRV